MVYASILHLPAAAPSCLRLSAFRPPSLTQYASDLATQVAKAAQRPLDERGLVVRRKDPSDRRCLRIHLTGAGRALLPDLHRASRDGDAAAREAISPAEFDQLLVLLGRVLAVSDDDRVS